MATTNEIRATLERNVKAVTLRPLIGQGTAVTLVTLGDNLRCEIREGPWTLSAGMTEKYGGDGSAPNPGVLGRAALGSCLAIGYAMWAARLEVPIAALTVEIHADYDVRGELGADDTVRPGHQQIRYVVTVTSAAPEADLHRLFDVADAHSSWRDNLSNPVPLVRELRVVKA